MNDGVDGEGIPGAEPAAADAPGPAAPAEWTSPESLAPPASSEPPQPASWSAPPPPSAQPAGPSAYPSGYPHWAASSTPTPPPSSTPAPPASAPWTREDPWAFTPPPPPPSYPGWTPAWPSGPASAPPPRASRRTAAIAAVLLFAAAAGASAGVVALTTRSAQPTSSTQSGSASPLGGGIFGNPGGGRGNGPSGSTSNGPLDQASIEAKLDPAIVDVVVSLAGGQGTAEGTGMIVTSGGQVLTNNHVIDGASTITVQPGGTGPTYTATVVGYDVTDDVALLQMQNAPSNLTTIDVGDPSQLNVGDSVLALGNALGRGGSPQAAAGTVTALDQTITAGDPSGQTETLSGLIETDAKIQPGDSGGPLVDSSGKVVGMDTAASVANGRFRQFGGATGQGYAIPIDTAMQIVQQIRSGNGSGNVQTGQRPIIGVEIADGTGGANVQGVTSGGPAEKAGIGAGDVITSVGGVQVTSASSLRAAILKHKVGDRVEVTWVDAGGQQHSATVTLVGGPPA